MKLYILSLGEACIDKGAVISPGVDDGKRVHIPIPAYLLEMDDGSHVLIDTGMHRKHIEDPEYTFRGTDTGKVLLPVMRREDSLIRRLAELVAAGQLSPHVSLERPWSEIAQVAQDLMARRFPGKAVLTLE